MCFIFGRNPLNRVLWTLEIVQHLQKKTKTIAVRNTQKNTFWYLFRWCLAFCKQIVSITKWYNINGHWMEFIFWWYCNMHDNDMNLCVCVCYRWTIRRLMSRKMMPVALTTIRSMINPIKQVCAVVIVPHPVHISTFVSLWLFFLQINYCEPISFLQETQRQKKQTHPSQMMIQKRMLKSPSMMMQSNLVKVRRWAKYRKSKSLLTQHE